MSSSPTTHVVIEPLSLLDKVSLVWRVPMLIIRCVVIFASKFGSHDEVSSLHWRQKLALAFMQASNGAFSGKQQAARRLVLTGPRIQEFCRKEQLGHRKVSLGDATLDKGRNFPTAVLHFITAPTAQSGGPTIFYMHGGGYHNPMRAEGHIPFVMLCAAACKAKQVVFLEYSLSPEEQYPCQLVQAVAGLRFLLEEESISAEDLVLGGDSAGGHLILGLLTHVAQPSPYALPIDLGGGQFKAVFLVSPWLGISADEQTTVQPQAQNDYLTPERIASFKSMFKPVLSEVWSNPDGSEDALLLWKKLFPGGNDHAICGKALLAVGGSETILDSCMRFGRYFLGCESIVMGGKDDLDLIRKTDFVLAIAPGESHVQPGLDCAVGYHDGRMTKAILAILETA